MGQLQKPIIISVANLLSLDLNTFKGVSIYEFFKNILIRFFQILQRAWSFFTALKNIHSKNTQELLQMLSSAISL